MTSITEITLAKAHGVIAVDRNVEMLHPKFRDAVSQLLETLAREHKAGRTRTLFQLFEGYRSPMRQADVLAAGATKARPWQSAHQYGLAVDIVAVVNGKWSWDSKEDWNFLARQAKKLGLRRPIEWDLCHIEHPSWQLAKKALL